MASKKKPAPSKKKPAPSMPMGNGPGRKGGKPC